MNKKTRVLHIVGKMQRAGLETMIMNYYRHLNRDLVQFDFLTLYEEKSTYDDEIIELGGKIYRFNVLEDKNIIFFIYKFYNFLKENKEYQIIHGHIPSLSFVYLFIGKILKRKVRILHSHNTAYSKNLKGYIANILQKPAKYVANYYFACSIEAGKWLFGEKRIKSDKFKILKNAIDVEKFIYCPESRYKLRKELKVKNNELLFGHIGRFEDQKNHVFLLQIYNEILKRNKNSRLILIGKGCMEFKIRKMATDMGIFSKIMFLGERNDINVLLSCMDAFILPSKFEGLGITLIEAQASGLPCFASSVVPREASVTDNIKYISLKRSAKNWASYILNILEKEKRKERGYYNQMVKKSYDIFNEAKKLQKFYTKNEELE